MIKFIFDYICGEFIGIRWLVFLWEAGYDREKESDI